MATIPTQTTAAAIKEVLDGKNSIYGASLNGAAFVKEANGKEPDQVGMGLSALQSVQAFSALVTQGLKDGSLVKTGVGTAGGLLSAASLVNNLNTWDKEKNAPNGPGVPSDKTLTGVASDLTALLAFYGSIAATTAVGSVAIATVGLTAAVGLGIYALSRQDGTTSIATAYSNLFTQAQTLIESPAGKIYDSTQTVTDIGGGATVVKGSVSWSEIDGDQKVQGGISGSTDYQWLFLNGQTYDLLDVTQALAADSLVTKLYNNALIGSGTYLDFSRTVSNTLVTTGGVTYIDTGLSCVNPSFYDPIGAFYEVKSAALDSAASIAAKTPVLLSANKAGLTVAALQTLDINKDGKLSGTELTGLQVWGDTNEDGIGDTTEFKSLTQAGISEIRAGDYAFYTRGNSIQAAAPAAAPAKGSGAGLPAKVNLVQSAPASNYRALRDTDNIYSTPYGYIFWAANQIKINYSNRTSLIGTDGNDRFDANYYAAYTQYFNSNLLVNFYAGGGDDVMGGSARNDNLWGGTGNDVLFGYAGDDKLYGEEGNDELQGGAGNDYLDGGIGNDKLFGQVGNDILNGGDGDDILMGFTAGNDTKQTLAAGETDNDTLYGGAGNDQLSGGLGDDTLDGGDGVDLIFGGQGNDIAFGGTGNDELHGNEGNDKLAGEAGDDKLFGEVGDDTIWGGDGNDILVGFTAGNDAKQTLAVGETDNDTLYGGAGDDQIYGGLGNDLLDGGDGNDLVSGDDGSDRLFGGAGGDELNGGAGDDQLSGEAGNDKLFGGVGNDRLWGGDGDDILVGFTAGNDAKQTLAAGETDNDVIYGGAGNDLALGGLGTDILYGEAGDDELQGGAGNDQLYGGDGNDRLFGQVGDDILYGGAGDDLLVGFTGANEAKQTLAANETDNDWLYGGAGRDTLIGGLGNDYLDGGAGADNMQGGQGDDTYIVNSVNDVILENAGEGYDTVISSSNYLLNANIEELRLVEGEGTPLSINATGNGLNNRLIGNSADNILDGVTGADTMIGGKGNDTYYVDNVGDVVVELAGEGTDTVQSKISYTLGANLENLNLLDFGKPEKGLVDGTAVLVYGYPKANELDYMQGDAVPTYKGTCALTSIANLLTQAKTPTTEAQVVQVAINNNWAVTSAAASDYQRGGSNFQQQQQLLSNYGIANNLLAGYNEQAIANLIRSGRGVILALNAGKLWNDTAYTDTGTVNHVVTLSGAVYGESDGALKGFYIADSGRQQVSDMTRYLSLADFRAAANVPNAYAIYTTEALKLWNEDIDGTGNALNNTLVGNRGNNVLNGGLGNDLLVGGLGNDTYLFNRGDGQDSIQDTDATIGNTDVLRLGGISFDQLWLKRSGNNLEASVIGTADKVTIQNWYAGSANHIERFEAGGRALLDSKVDLLVQAMAAFAPPAAGQSTLPDNYRQALAPVLAANWQ